MPRRGLEFRRPYAILGRFSFEVRVRLKVFAWLTLCRPPGTQF